MIELFSKYWVMIIVGCLYLADRIIYVQKTMPLLNLSQSNFIEVMNGVRLFSYKKACKENGLPLKWFWIRIALLLSFWVVIVLSIFIDVNAG